MERFDYFKFARSERRSNPKKDRLRATRSLKASMPCREEGVEV
jgi:hypothetical protein